MDFSKPVFKHRTPSAGTFRIFWTTRAGNRVFELTHNGRHVALAFDPSAIGRELRDGGYDSKLGFASAPLAIPSDPHGWNGME